VYKYILLCVITVDKSITIAHIEPFDSSRNLSCNDLNLLLRWSFFPDFSLLFWFLARWLVLDYLCHRSSLILCSHDDELTFPDKR